MQTLRTEETVCANCGRQPRVDENHEDDSDGVGELHTFCPDCWRKEFGAEGRALA